MKKITFSAFVAFWASAVTVALLHVLAPQPDSTPRDNDELPGYTLEDVAEHDTLDSCWMAIEGKVYDFTDYIPDHPTPARIMEVWCGREATEGMRTKGIGRDHSPAAWAMMRPYRIGELVEE